MKYLPFRYNKLDDRYLLTNDIGEYIILSKDDFNSIINNKIIPNHDLYNNLKSKLFLYDSDAQPIIDMVATRLRTKKSFLMDFTSLHMVVPTIRCNSNCKYCQASSKSHNEKNYDLDVYTAKKITDNILSSPSNNIKIEFQGGEPLLNFKIVKFIVRYAKRINHGLKKNLEFVICSNLTPLNMNMLRFIKNHNIYLSSSLDGPQIVHNYHRPLIQTPDSYTILQKRIKLVREYLGHDKLSCLMTLTNFSKDYIKEIIDEYINLDFHSIFIRPINPYGRATITYKTLLLDLDAFNKIYLEAFDYILELNLKGFFLVEEYATILLKKILTPFSTGFVDLQNPPGFGISCALYNYNGDVYGSDEARMLGEMGDKTFLLGNIHTHTYEQIFLSEQLKSIISESLSEFNAECTQCAFQPYCGADPIRNYIESKNKKHFRISKSNFCKRNRFILSLLFKKINENNADIMNIFWAWICNNPQMIYEKN